ncbi:MAG: trypsin-like peptidase domain-containing protein [Acutalibacteraceae bacterium]
MEDFEKNNFHNDDEAANVPTDTTMPNNDSVSGDMPIANDPQPTEPQTTRVDEPQPSEPIAEQPSEPNVTNAQPNMQSGFTNGFPPFDRPQQPQQPYAAQPQNPQQPIDNNTRSFTPPTYRPTQPPYNQPQYNQYGGAQYGGAQNPQYAAQSNVNGAQNPFNQPPKPKNSKTGLKVFCVILAVAVLLSVGVGVGYIAGGNRDLRNDNSQNNLGSQGGTVVIEQGTVPTKEGVEKDADGKYTAEGVAEIVSDSVVNIIVYNDSGSSSAIASGVIMNTDGYILSNDHIYSDIANAKFAITLNNGKCYEATYVAGDSRSDLCVLKMKDAKDLTPAVFADSSQLKTGDDVVAIGSPYGLTGTVTKGIVSAPSRRISFSSTVNGNKANYSMRVIQTDTPLNSGNSGGALVNMYGQVVGISSSKIVLSGYEGLCFAIPANDAIKTAKSLIENKKVVGRARLGITYTEINSAKALVNKLPTGLMIQSVDIDSDLYNSGLKQGDIITEINGTTITAADVALDIIDDSTAGDSMTLKVYVASSGKYKTMTAKMLEDKSVSSYTTQEQQTTTSSFPIW